MGITSTVAYYVTQGYPMRIWTHFLLRVSKKAWPGTILITWDTNVTKYA
jgi:hypothetical protein